MQKWEYETITWARGTPSTRELQPEPISYHEPWDTFGNKDLDQMGADGWELVSVVPISDHVGVGAAGATTMLIFFYKKPIG